MESLGKLVGNPTTATEDIACSSVVAHFQLINGRIAVIAGGLDAVRTRHEARTFIERRRVYGLRIGEVQWDKL